MSSDLEMTKSLEWCAELPSSDGPRESPVFLLNGDEWRISFVLEKKSNTWYYGMYVKPKLTHRNYTTWSAIFKVGFKNDKISSLYDGYIQISKYGINSWRISVKELQSKLPSNYIDGNWIKFLFCFKDEARLLLKSCKKTDDKSTQTPLYFDTHFSLECSSKDLNTLLDDGPNHDVEFAFEDQTIKAHKNILCCRSAVFTTMLQSDMIEGNTGRVSIQDMDAKIFQIFLKYLYTGMLPELTVDVTVQLYTASDKYAVDTLKLQCAAFLTDNLSLENVCEILVLADQCNDQDLKKSVMNYVFKEKVPVMGEKWTEFCNENPKLAIEVLNLFCQQLCIN